MELGIVAPFRVVLDTSAQRRLHVPHHDLRTECPSRTAMMLLFPAVLLLVLAGRALVAGTPAVPIVWTCAFVAGWILLPGWGLRRWSCTERRDSLHEWCLAAVLGVASLIAAYFAVWWCAQPSWLWAWPAVGILFLALSRRAIAQETPVAWPRGACVALALVLTAALFWTSYRAPDQWWWRIDEDVLFHVGNAAELMKPPPIDDPRVAGQLLNYHVFSYAPVAGLATLSGLPVATIAMGSMAGLSSILLVLAIVALAVRLTDRPWAGVLAGAVWLVHSDIGQGLKALGVQEWRVFGPWLFSAAQPSLLLSSSSTAWGLVFGLVLVLALVEHLRSGAWRSLAVLALLAAVASGTKGSTMPVVIGGLAGYVAWERIRHGPFVRPGLALVTLGIAAAPMTLYLMLGPNSVGQAMLHVQPLAIVADSGFGRSIQGSNQVTTTTWMLAVPWLLGYAGPVLWLGLGWMWISRRKLPGFLPWLIVVGIGFGLVLNAPQRSQLFFVHLPECLLAVAAGCLLNQITTLRRSIAAGWIVTCLPFWIAGTASLSRAVGVAFDHPAEPEIAREWRRGAEWIRTQTPVDTILVSDCDEMILSAFAERRCFFESGKFTASKHAAREDRAPWVSLRASRLAAVEGAPDAMAQIRRRVDLQGASLLLVVQRVQRAGSDLSVEDIALAAPPRPSTFQNRAMEISSQ